MATKTSKGPFLIFYFNLSLHTLPATSLLLLPLLSPSFHCTHALHQPTAYSPGYFKRMGISHDLLTFRLSDLLHSLHSPSIHHILSHRAQLEDHHP